MTHFSDYAENCLIDYFFRRRAPGGIAGGVPWYVALTLNVLSDADDGSTIIEPNSFDYQRQMIMRDFAPANDFSAPIDGLTHNNSDIIFGQAELDWGTINGVCIVNGASNADPTDIIFWINIPPTPMQIGDYFKIPAGALTVQLQ